MKTVLVKLASELRKLAKEAEEKKMSKCANVMSAAKAITKLKDKIRGKK